MTASPERKADPEPGAARRPASGSPASSRPALALAVFLFAAGLAHFTFPRPYRQIVPRLLDDAAFWVRLSAGTEIACAALVACPRTRSLGAKLAIVIFVAVLPANVQMALDGGIPGEPFPLGSPAVAWLRLPLQVPLILWAHRVASSQGRSSPSAFRRWR